MSAAQRGRVAGLRAITRVAGSPALDRLRLRRPLERLLYGGSKSGFRAAVAAGRSFSAVSKLGRPARQSHAPDRGLFDLTPSDEQAMLCEAISDFAANAVRPAAVDADAATATPAELLEQAAELGLAMLGIPEELGGVMAERSAVTTVLAAEALAHGDMGIAFAALAPAAVASAIGLWGDDDQQAAYLPPFTGEQPPVAALALLEPTPAFDPLGLAASARRDGPDWVLEGVKSLVPRAADGELFIVAANASAGTGPDGQPARGDANGSAAGAATGPALFIVEAGAPGLSAEPEPAMGLRAASTARLHLDGVRVPASALLGGGDPEIYAECVQRARIAWSALATGAARAVLDYVIPYVKEREAFGESIANRQAVAFAVADIAIELDGMRLVTWRAASRADRGRAFAREAALARSLCSSKAMRIGADGVQLLGGHGYVKDHPVERWYRDLRAAGLMEGALLA
jgi:alkylation response protein AidB-like acyl-CoA dehydrogenase